MRRFFKKDYSNRATQTSPASNDPATIRRVDTVAELLGERNLANNAAGDAVAWGSGQDDNYFYERLPWQSQYKT